MSPITFADTHSSFGQTKADLFQNDLASFSEAPCVETVAAELDMDNGIDGREQELIRDVPSILDKMNKASSELNMFTDQANEAEKLYNDLLREWNRLNEEVQKEHAKPMERIQPYMEAAEKRSLAAYKVRGAAGAFAAASAQEEEARLRLTAAQDAVESCSEVALQVHRREALLIAMASVKASQKLRRKCESEFAQAVREHQETQELINRWRGKVGDLTRTLACVENLQERRRLVDEAWQRVDNLKQHGCRAKEMYRFYMNELERISEAVHETRQINSAASQTPRTSAETKIDQAELSRQAPECTQQKKSLL